MAAVSNRWAILALMFLVGFTVPLQFQVPPALATFLIADAGLSYTDIGVLTGLFMLPGIFLAAPIGMLASAIGDRLTLIIGLIVMGSATVMFSMTDSYAVMLSSRLIGGAGAVAVSVLMPKVITDWFAPGPLCCCRQHSQQRPALEHQSRGNGTVVDRRSWA